MKKSGFPPLSKIWKNLVELVEFWLSYTRFIHILPSKFGRILVEFRYFVEYFVEFFNLKFISKYVL